MANAIIMLYKEFELESAKLKKQSLQRSNIPEKHEQCYFNGIRKRIIQGDYNNFSICICDPGYEGENCEFLSSNIFRWNEKAMEYLREIQNDVQTLTHQKRSIILYDFILLNNLPLGYAEIAQMSQILREYLILDPFLDSQKSLYIIFDLMLLNCLRLLEIERQWMFRKSKFEIENLRSEKDLSGLIKNIILLIESCLEDLRFANSFLQIEGVLAQLLTTTFKLHESRYADLDEDNGLIVANPVIDRDWGITGQIVIKPNFSDKSFKNSNFNLQILTLSLTLFRSQIPESEHIMTMILYMKNVNPNQPHVKVLNSNIGLVSFRASFAIIFFPSFVNIKKSVLCKAYTFDKDKEPLYGELVEFSREKETVDCLFNLNSELSSYYFAAVSKKEDI